MLTETDHRPPVSQLIVLIKTVQVWSRTDKDFHLLCHQSATAAGLPSCHRSHTRTREGIDLSASCLSPVLSCLLISCGGLHSVVFYYCKQTTSRILHIVLLVKVNGKINFSPMYCIFLNILPSQADVEISNFCSKPRKTIWTEALYWRSSTGKQSAWPAQIFNLGVNIISLQWRNADMY